MLGKSAALLNNFYSPYTSVTTTIFVPFLLAIKMLFSYLLTNL